MSHVLLPYVQVAVVNVSDTVQDDSSVWRSVLWSTTEKKQKGALLCRMRCSCVAGCQVWVHALGGVQGRGMLTYG